ncbi:phage tail tape measure protein [Microbacterium gubbeenense]|uniref:phage tail tape measure protein n=1 Tax=Microbacterium gubbeenense TaxID=159896 RepID=UPI000A032080|nr:phage tail tape measure protein [Microbacterium gubbeenense]
MAGQGVELATAWVRLVPSMEGATDSIVKSLAPGTAAAEKEGTKAGKGWSSRVKKAIGVAAIGGAVVGAFKGLYSVGDTFDQVTDQIRTGTGASGRALDGLVESAKEVGKTIPIEFGTAGDAIAALNTYTGESGKSLENLSTQVLESSRLLGEDGVANAEAYGQALNQWSLDADTGAESLDGLFKVTQDYGVGLGGLIGQLNTYGSVLQNAGFSMEESAVLFGSLQKSGLDVSRIMPGLNKSFRDWAGEGKDVQAELGRTVSAIAEAETSTEALALATDVFGAEGAQRMTTAIRNGSFALEDLDGALSGSAGLIRETGEEQMSFSERWQQTMNTAMTAIEPLATGIFQALSDGLTAAMPTLQALGEWVSQNTTTIGVIAGVIGVTLVAAMVAWTASIWASTVALLANPVTWIIVGIMALIAAVVALVMNWDEVVAFITGIWSGFIDWVVSVGEGFLSWWNGLWSAVGQWIQDTWNGFTSWVESKFQGFLSGVRAIGQAISDWWNGLWSGIGNFVRDTWEGFTSWVEEKFRLFMLGVIIVGDQIASWWNGLWSGISGFVTDTWNGFVGWVMDIFGGFAAGIRGIGDGIASWWNGLWSGIGSFFESIFGGLAGFAETAFNAVLGAVKAPVNGIIGLINGAISGLNSLSVSIPDWVPIVGGQTWGLSIPQIPYLAKGATVLPRSGGTLAVLAEAGRPESVVDTGLMNRALEEGLSGEGGSGTTVQGPLVHVEHMTVDSEQRVDEVSRALYERAERAERAQGKVNLGGAVTA